MIHHITTDQLKDMAGGDGLILQGCGGDLAEWQNGINEMFTDADILKNGGEFKDIYVFEHGGVTNILYPFEGLTPDTLDMRRLAIWRLQNHDNFAGIWLSDYLPNRLGVREMEYDIGSRLDEYGVTVWNENDATYADGSEKHIAHINHEREITYLEDNLPDDVVSDIEAIAEGDWKEMFAIEMAEIDQDSTSPPPNLPFGPPPRYDEHDIDLENPPPIVSFGERRSPYRDEGAEGPHPSDIENYNAPIYPFQAYVENIHDKGIGGFTIPFPTDPAELQSFLESAEIADWRGAHIVEIETPSESDFWRLADKLNDIISNTPMSPDTFNELNYLAARIETVAQRGELGGIEIILANIEAGRNCGSVTEIINLTLDENLNQFDIFPTFDERDYGDILVNQFRADEHAIAFNRLKNSDELADQAFAAHIEKLEKHVDLVAFGRTAAKEEGGIFTEHGYLVGNDSDLQQLYRGAQDIPAEHCLLSQSAKDVARVMKIDDVNIAETIVKLHAVGCRSMEHAARNVNNFLTEHKQLMENNDSNNLLNHYILVLNRSDVCIAPVMDVYRRGSEMNNFALNMTELAAKGAERSDIKVFAVRVNNTEKAGRDLRGDLIELSPQAFNSHINRYAATPDRVDALHKNGVTKSYDLFSWGQMLQQQGRNSAELVALHYPKDGLEKAANNFGNILSSHEMTSQADSFEAHLPRISNLYGVTVVEDGHSHSGMISIANEAAREILARGDADVYRLTGSDTVKLNTIEALRPMCFAEYRNLAIKQKDAAGLDKWAEHKVGDIVRQTERAERSKAKNKGEEI